MDLGANGGETFALYLNGYTGAYSQVLSASMDPQSSNYFAKVFNTDPASIETKGHLLYAHFDIDPALAVSAPANGLAGHRTRVLLTS